MRKMCTVLLLILPFSPLYGQRKNHKAPTRPPTSDTQLLAGLEEKWVTALTKSDTATLDSILSDTYVDTDERGERTNKQSVLSDLKSGDLWFESIKLSDLQVRTYGDAAVVTGSAAQTGKSKGQPLTAAIVFTDTFIRQNGKWTAVASHRSATNLLEKASQRTQTSPLVD